MRGPEALAASEGLVEAPSRRKLSLLLDLSLALSPYARVSSPSALSRSLSLSLSPYLALSFSLT